VDTLELDLPTRRATRRLGVALGPMLAPGDVVWLEGELGAGKTFFARGLLRALGVPEAVPVTSPTFALVHEHEGRVPIRHLDLYRIDDAGELKELGIDEALDSAVVVIEWGARLRDAIGARGLEIALVPRDRGRAARLRALDARARSLLDALARDPHVARMRRAA
jgi:tRNA threonylcarbamoyladenosine biosynthesis protein TsaE